MKAQHRRGDSVRVDRIMPQDIEPGDTLTDRRIAHLVLDLYRHHRFSEQELRTLEMCAGNLAHILAEEVVEF